VGTGIDIVENERMGDILRRRGRAFKDRVFLAREQAYCESKAFPLQHYASRFAVKEAVSKALGTGLGHRLGWKDIEVVRDVASGAPSVRLSPGGRKLARALHVGEILVSLSHSRHYAVAQAIAVAGAPAARKERRP
jgi:holo-[acyl-carrier protein] synthase